MPEEIYKELQSYLSYKIKNNPYSRSSWKTEQAYEEAMLSVKSKVKEIYERNKKEE